MHKWIRRFLMQITVEIKIPVNVLYSIREDNSVSIDAVSIPDENEIYGIVDKNAENIKNHVRKINYKSSL